MNLSRGTWGLALVLALTAACGPKTMEARLRDAERHADKAAAALDDAQAAAEALEPEKMKDALDDAKERLSEADVELHPETSMHQDRYKELFAKYPQVKAEREKRDLEQKLNAARDRIVPRVQAMLEAQEALSATAPTRAQFDALTEKAEKVREAVDDEKGLFEKDADFAAWAKSQRGKVDRAMDAAAKAKKVLAVVEGPGAAWAEAQQLQAEAKKAKTPADKEPVLLKLKERLAACESSAQPLLSEPAAVVVGSGKPQTAAQLQAACKAALKPADAELKKVQAALAKAKKAPPAPAPKKKTK